MDAESQAEFDAMLAEHGGDAMALAATLESRNAELQARYAEARGAEPPEGAVILTGDDAADWEAYRGLGTPDAIRAAREELPDLRARAARIERDALLERHGFNAETLAMVLPADASVEEVGPAGRLGGGIRVAVAGAKAVPLDEYIRTNLAGFPAGAFRVEGPARDPAPVRGAPPTPCPATRPPAPGEGPPDGKAAARDELLRSGLYGI